MKKYTCLATACLAAGCVVSCTSLPSDINTGIKSGNPHAYYEAGQHIDNSKTVDDCPQLVNLLCFPINIGTVAIGVLLLQNEPVAVQNCFYYRSKASKYEESAKYYAKGAALGDVDCLTRMGYCYEIGLGVPRDTDTAKQYYIQAAARGSECSKSRLKGLAFEAPNSITGKTFTFTAPIFLVNDEAYPCEPHTIVWRGGNQYKEEKEGSEYYSHSYEYKKTGKKTAKITNEGYDGYIDVGEDASMRFTDYYSTSYELKFETPTSGTCRMEEGLHPKGSCPEIHTAFGRFTLK